MNDTTQAAMLIAVVLAFAAGYSAAYLRPLHRIDNWAWRQVDRRERDCRSGPARRRPGWYAAQAVFAVELAAVFAVRPRQTVRNIRHHNDPEPRWPAPEVRDLTTKETTTGGHDK